MQKCYHVYYKQKLDVMRNIKRKLNYIFQKIRGLQPRIIIILAMIIIGIITLIATKAATISTSFEPENGSATAKVVDSAGASGGKAIKFGKSDATCGKRVANYTYQVPWGNAVWNQPVCNLPRYAKSADYASRFYLYVNVNDGTPATQTRKGEVNVAVGIPKPTLFDPEGLSTLFSRNVYYASDATTTTLVQASVYASNLDGTDSYQGNSPTREKFLPDARIPWNPAWRTGEGGDNEIVVLDQSNGRIYNISGYKRGLAAFTQCGPFVGDRLCTAATDIGRDTDGKIFDYRTYEGYVGNRGVGLSAYATLTTPEEVKAGEIRHALGVGIPNTATGPICSSSQLGTPAEGFSCGIAVAPATKFEWGSANSSAERGNIDPALNNFYTQSKMIPEGMRFAIDITDAQIEAWVLSRPNLVSDPLKASTARIYARALRDYGMMIVDTGGYGAVIQTAGSVNPAARQLWAEVGVDSESDGQDILDGLITATNLYVVEPPTVTCLNGATSKYYCPWTKATY